MPPLNNKYNKQKLTLEEQLQVLQKRGLLIDNLLQAKNILESTSYFHLSGYWNMMERDHKKHIFRPESKFSTVVDYYNFDKELKLLIFSAIQIIEVALRTKMIKHFGNEPFWFMFREYAINADHFQENYERIEKEVKRSRERFIVEHFQKYAQPTLPPVWKTLEVISFGVTSKLYKNFNDSKAKHNIAHEFGLRHHDILTNWLGCITILRNYCAHHSRVFNRIFPLPTRVPKELDYSWITNTDFSKRAFYPIICAIIYMLDFLVPESSFKQKFLSLLDTYSLIDTTLMGFPGNWREEKFWKV